MYSVDWVSCSFFSGWKLDILKIIGVFKPHEASTKRTADAIGVGIATVKRILADFNRDPALLNKPTKIRGRPTHAVNSSYQGVIRAYIRSANKKGEYITINNIRDFLKENSIDANPTLRE